MKRDSPGTYTATMKEEVAASTANTTPRASTVTSVYPATTDPSTSTSTTLMSANPATATIITTLATVRRVLVSASASLHSYHLTVMPAVTATMTTPTASLVIATGRAPLMPSVRSVGDSAHARTTTKASTVTSVPPTITTSLSVFLATAVTWAHRTPPPVTL